MNDQKTDEINVVQHLEIDKSKESKVEPKTVEIINKSQNDEKNQVEKKNIVSFWKLQCHFSDKIDILFLIIAIIGSVGAGVSMPIFALIFGATINSFNDTNVNNPQILSSVVGGMAINYIIAGSGVFFFFFINGHLLDFKWKKIDKENKSRVFPNNFKTRARLV